MRWIAVFAGLLLSMPTLLFFWIGTRTFVKARERSLAVILTLKTGALLVLSLALLFTPAVQWVQAVLIGTTLISLAVILVRYRHSR